MTAVEGYGSITTNIEPSETVVQSHDEWASNNMHRSDSQKKTTTLLLTVVCLFLLLVEWWHGAATTTGENRNSAVASVASPMAMTQQLSSSSLLESKEVNRNHPKYHDPAKVLYFDQIVDHNHPDTSGTFQQRYYENLNYWKGPGHPIFLIFGGEGELPKILYPFVSEVLAKQKGAYTICPEHRYFGKSYPMSKPTKNDIATQLTPRQALQDTVRLIQAKQHELGCGPRGSKTYCPVMTVGGSYAGILSTLIRVAYPQVVDMAYSGSPCLRLFDHTADPETYYDFITEVAERISHGCANAVKGTLLEIKAELETATRKDLKVIAPEYGICSTLPADIEKGSDLAEIIIDYLPAHVGDTNMDYYPPGPDQKFYKGCTIFQDTRKTARERVKNYIQMISDSSACYDLDQPSNDVSSGDDDHWNVLCCYLLPMIGKSKQSMFMAEEYILEDDIQQCANNYGITADPDYLRNEFDFQDLMTTTSRILLTNGLNDGWYPLSYTQADDVGPGVVVMDFVNGSHHSDLTHQLQVDTPDVEQGHKDISALIDRWLKEIRKE